jgi:hypothetical protein
VNRNLRHKGLKNLKLFSSFDSRGEEVECEGKVERSTGFVGVSIRV